MSNSKLVSYTRLSPNHSGRRKYDISRITPHYVGGNATVETLGEIFAPTSRQASSNYGIGSDGRVGMYVEESNRAWTSGNADNDNRAVTIECANLSDGSLTDKAWKTLVELCADICQRNGKSRIVYTGDVSNVNDNEMLLTKHKWFQSTDCPGPWLDGQFERLASEVNAKLGGKGAKVLVRCNDVAAIIHYDMVTDERNGYSQYPQRWGGDHPDGVKRLTIYGREYEYRLGSMDCSSSEIVAWRQAIRYTPYEGCLDAATCTSDMRAVFVGSGLFTASLTPAKRGDLYLAEGKHTAMCQDGGSDGMFGYDCLSEFNRNENGGAYNGKPGDQDGMESVLREYYDDGWNTVLHYNGNADYYIENDSNQKSGQSEDEMICLIQPNGKNYMAYFDGSKLYALTHEDEANAIREVYKKTHNGAKIPEFAFGSEKAPWATRLLGAISRPITKI